MHETLLAIFNALSPFFWAGKGVIALAAFAVNYGEFWLVEQLRSSNNPVAQSLASLEPLPREEQLSMFQDMSRLVQAILKLTKCICESFDLQNHKYFQPDEPVYNSMMAQIPEYTYWIIRSIVICQSNLNAYGGVINHHL
ncbi:UNVERIFIED_CONTAM: protein SIEVE ELEMENT OCCLUSION B [Sesamum radiatum]|uniref:Protein SIEVE ELEMENT OCCLUSION B n=1 Tax=Sesamum radiatum TaxID=300843 RepID=A0AAW2T5J8_SESRA